MITHTLLSEINAQNPASFSKTVITALSGGDIHSDGVVPTDDMTIGSIDEICKIGEAAVKPVQAGAEIILVCMTRKATRKFWRYQNRL